MNESQVQLRILELCRKFRKSPGQLTDAEFRRISLMARESLVEKVAAGASAVASKVRTDVLKLRVLPSKSAANKATCEACPTNRYSVLADGASACMACGCSGRYLSSKWVDPSGSCPENHWTNVGAETVDDGKGFSSSIDSGGDARVMKQE